MPKQISGFWRGFVLLPCTARACIVGKEHGVFCEARKHIEILSTAALTLLNVSVQGETALIVATKRGLVDVINFLLEADADVNVIAVGPRTLVPSSARNPHAQLCVSLVYV